MGGDRSTVFRGADQAIVRRAREERDPLPGTAGFAGLLDGELVRDVLGRQPIFYDEAAVEPSAHENWSFDPTDLASPESVPAGTGLDGDGVTEYWSLPEPSPVGDREVSADRLRAAIETGIDSITDEGLAIAFSGGIDSAVLAARLDAPLYVTGFPDSHDVEAARSAAAALDRELTVIELDHETIREAVPRVAQATGRTNAMDVSIAIPLLVTAERVAADGYDRLAVGQGADELFGGYAKVAKAPDDPRVEADTVAGARRETIAGLPDQLERDVLAIRSAGVEPVAPYLHDDVVSVALELPGDALVTDDGTRKWALREAAREWLPAEITDREKKAMQYGSLASRELDRLARQAGYKRRMEDHVGRYVDHLCHPDQEIPEEVREAREE